MAIVEYTMVKGNITWNLTKCKWFEKFVEKFICFDFWFFICVILLDLIKKVLVKLHL